MTLLFFILTLLTIIFPTPAFAHAFGQNYSLNLPWWLYFNAAAAVVVVSFVLAGIFLKSDKQNFASSVEIKLPKSLKSDLISFLLQTFSLLLFILLILAGFLGSKNPSDNFLTVYFWIIFWLGFTYLVAIFGNLWQILSPVKIMTEIWQALTGQKVVGQLKYPIKLGYYPALLFYFGFIWLELLSNGLGISPPVLAIFILLYTVASLFGVFLYGTIWLERAEFLTVFFNLISTASLFKTKKDTLHLRLPFHQLLEKDPADFSQLIFILLILSSTAFDGFRATTLYGKLMQNLPVQFETLFLLITLALFLLLYLIAIKLMAVLTKIKLPTLHLATRFAYSLVPIAFVYNIAHYYTLLLIQGQSIIYLISDPFRMGWNLFGTVDYAINVGLLNIRFIWDSQVVLIIFGHVVAVAVTHLIALKTFTNRQVLISQLPMLVLMVIYTVTGLWILSQPLRAGGT